MEEKTPIKELEKRVQAEIKELEQYFMKSKAMTSKVSLRGSIGALEDVLKWITELNTE